MHNRRYDRIKKSRIRSISFSATSFHFPFCTEERASCPSHCAATAPASSANVLCLCHRRLELEIQRFDDICVDNQINLAKVHCAELCRIDDERGTTYGACRAALVGAFCITQISVSWSPFERQYSLSTVCLHERMLLFKRRFK